jgi:hypothetical protein
MHIQKNLLFQLGLVLITSLAYTQTLRYPVAANYTAMGAYSKNFNDVLSFTSNQAVLGKMKSIGAGVYSERRFLLEDLNSYTMAFCLPVRFGGIGISAKYSGYQSYRESQLGVAYGKDLGNIDIGIQFDYLAVHIPGYGRDGLITIEGGVILEISEQLHAGVHVFNPTGSRFGKQDREKLASIYTTGLGYEASEKVFVCVEIIKEEEKPVCINAGVNYVFAKKFFARMGLLTETNNLYFAAGWKWNNLRIDITSGYHGQLGFSPGLLFLFQGNSKKE